MGREDKMYNKCCELLKQRGVELSDIAELIYFLQGGYYPELSDEKVYVALESVLRKREVQHAILTGISLDIAAEEHRMIDKDLEGILLRDEGLFGVDEVLGFGICNLYGSIALTSFGYIDKLKPGIVGKLNEKGSQCNTFLDDIVGAIAATSASKIAHNLSDNNVEKQK